MICIGLLASSASSLTCQQELLGLLMLNTLSPCSLCSSEHSGHLLFHAWVGAPLQVRHGGRQREGRKGEHSRAQQPALQQL